MDVNKIRFEIFGSEYCLSTDEDENYMIELASQVDKRLNKIARENPYLSKTQTAIFLALQYADEEHKASETAASLRSQIKEYLEKAADARTEAEIARREVKRLQKLLEDKN